MCSGTGCYSNKSQAVGKHRNMLGNDGNQQKILEEIIADVLHQQN
jgi:hypothetical protein